MTINLSATLVYLVLLYLTNLARGAIGGFFIYAHYLILILPVVSTIHLIITMIFLRYIQDFSSFHSVRGDRVTYRLRLSQEFPLFSANIGIEFKHINPHMGQIMESRTIIISPGKRLEFEFEIPCPYIGVYTIGLQELVVRDMIGWLTLPQSVFFYTMYVYPRVLDSRDFDLMALSERSRTGSRLGSNIDYSYFERLREYRPGMDTRMMAWKRFAAQGVAVLRVYNRVSDPGITLYLDTSREEGPVDELIEREDFSLEVLVSVAGECLRRGQPVGIRARGLEPMILRNSGDLQHLINASLNVEFSNQADMIALFLEDQRRNEGTGSSAIFISHDVTPELIRIFLRPPGESHSLEAIINETGSDEHQRISNRRRIIPLGSGGERIRVIDASKIDGDRLIWQ
jgi:uncharacterized protein (DUF58 family)